MTFATLPHLLRATRTRTSAGGIVRAKAPLRVSFAGGGTDLPHWYEEHGGAVFSGTIDRYAYVTLYPRDDQNVRIRSLDLGQIITYDVNQAPTYDGVLDLAQRGNDERWDGRDHHRHGISVRRDRQPGRIGSDQCECSEQHVDHGKHAVTWGGNGKHSCHQSGQPDWQLDQRL